MKQLFLRTLHYFLETPIFYKLIQIFIWEKWTFDARKISKILSPSNTVISGLFKGMKYPNLESAGSALLPKIIGNYEDELQDSYVRLLGNNYSEILDIGCAEGYFAVGFAMKQKGAKVYAYDTDKKALDLCKAMAQKNNVATQMVYNGTCTADELANFKFTGRGLILSDCEGYEKELFTINNVSNLKNCDIVIEVHDMYEGVNKEYFIKLFEPTHKITIIESKYKFMKDYPELNQLPPQYKNDAFLIERGSRMEWLVIESKL